MQFLHEGCLQSILRGNVTIFFHRFFDKKLGSKTKLKGCYNDFKGDILIYMDAILILKDDIPIFNSMSDILERDECWEMELTILVLIEFYI